MKESNPAPITYSNQYQEVLEDFEDENSEDMKLKNQFMSGEKYFEDIDDAYQYSNFPSPSPNKA